MSSNRKPSPEKDYICKKCGSPFKSRASKVYYCSLKCSRAAIYENKMLDYKWRLKKLYAMAKNRARDKDVPFDIDMEHLLELWGEGFCSLSGIPLELGRSERGKVHPYAPSLDRIKPELGYTKGNVRIVCYQMNIAISEFGLEQFEEFIKLYNTNGAH